LASITSDNRSVVWCKMRFDIGNGTV